MRASLITAANPWQTVDVYASVDSTNLEALRHPRPWRVVVADFQSAGRGRLARQWRAPPAASIAVSAVVPMPDERTADWGWLPLLTGMAMCAALADVAQVPGRLKWPNDVLVQEVAEGPTDHPSHGGASAADSSRADPDPADPSCADQSRAGASQGDDGRPWLKICGVLCETVPGGLVVIGAGANIAQERAELPVDTATSLALCGAGNVRREEVIEAYLAHLADLHRTWSAGGAGLAALRTAYRSSCLTIGLEVVVQQPDGRVARGTATGVDDTGRLVVQTGGSSTVHAAGDVVHVRRAQTPTSGTA